MKIGGDKLYSELVGYLSGDAKVAGAKQGQKSEPGRAASDASDRVEISDESREKQALRSAVDAAPDTRDDKVKALKEAVDNGTYDSSGANIADKIIERSVIDTLL